MRGLTIQLPVLPTAAEEAMNRLRVNIKFVGSNTRRIIVTSSIPNEGKSSISLYLWKMLAEAGFPTLYIDLDLRKSVMTTRYPFTTTDGNVYGLEHYLSGLMNYQDIIYRTNYENGYMIPCANILQNPASLFMDPKFSSLLDQLSTEYRYIIIDTPPLMDVSDGTQIASLCDGAVLVVRSEFTSKKYISRSLRELQQVNCPLLGIVLNRVSQGKTRYGYGYGYYRSGYYNGYSGYGYGKKKRPSEK